MASFYVPDDDEDTDALCAAVDAYDDAADAYDESLDAHDKSIDQSKSVVLPPYAAPTTSTYGQTGFKRTVETVYDTLDSYHSKGTEQYIVTDSHHSIPQENSPKRGAFDKTSMYPQVKCSCGKPADVKTSNSAKNPNRDYYKCLECNLFLQWCDAGPSQTNPAGSKDVSYRFTPTNTGAMGQDDANSLDGPKCGADQPLKAPGPVGGSNTAGAIGAGGSGDRPCFTCGLTGHWSRDCPSKQQGSGGSTYGGGSTFGGSTYGGSSSYGGPQGAPGAIRTNDTCYKCGESGHWSSKCPNQGANQRGGSGLSMNNGRSMTGTSYKFSTNSNSGGRGSQGQGQGSGCFKCGGTGHFARDCTGR